MCHEKIVQLWVMSRVKKRACDSNWEAEYPSRTKALTVTEMRPASLEIQACRISSARSVGTAPAMSAIESGEIGSGWYKREAD